LLLPLPSQVTGDESSWRGSVANGPCYSEIEGGDSFMNITKHRVTRAGATAVLAGAFAAAALGAAGPASADTAGVRPAAVGNCSHGLNTATKAWGTCTTGSGKWTLTAQCFAWGANTANGNGPGSIYATCPSWSHVTNVILNVQE
jgi:hypothetical protein